MQIRPHIPLWLRAPRSSLFLVLAVVLLACIAVVSPVQLPVALYKLTLIALAAVIGYWLDRALFPYARPDSYLERDWRRVLDRCRSVGRRYRLCVDRPTQPRRAFGGSTSQRTPAQPRTRGLKGEDARGRTRLL